MLQKQFLLLIVFFCIASTIFAQTVTGVRISFKTTDNDKDDDTGVETIFKTSNNTDIAYRRDNYGHFNDHSEFNADLQMRNSSIDCNNMAGSTITINIFPNGHDTWNFDFDLIITCSDGSTKSYPFRGIHLTQSNINFVGTLTN
jgi:hypothetical protein